MNGMNEKTPESYECKRQRRLQKQREQRRTTLACGKKEQRTLRLQERRLQLRREARNRRREQTHWAS